ncbi:MAG: hypothetical protein ACYDGU_10150 [Acidiferrobacterales bacterium]
MAKILTFKKVTARDRNRGKTLCANNFHRWQVVTEKRFDVKRGRLVTALRCERCGKEKLELL